MNKRILVRLINHTTGHNEQRIINSSDSPKMIRNHVVTALAELTKPADCSVSHNLDRLVDNAKNFGHVQHSTQVIDRWLVPLRIDAAKTQIATNDNQEDVREANG